MRALTISVLLLLSIGCSPTRQASRVERSGFLGSEHYGLLEMGGEGEALEMFRAPDFDPAAYDSVFIEPVEIYVGDPKNFTDSKEELEHLAHMSREALVAELGKDFQVVDTAGPKTLRVRAALTEAIRSSPISDTITTFYPAARVFSFGRRLITDVDVFVGRASAEIAITDSETGVPVFLAVDRRVGQKAILGVGDDWKYAEWDGLRLRSWGDVHTNVKVWSMALRAVLMK